MDHMIASPSKATTRRVHIFVGVSLTLLLIAILRLAQMQLLADSSLRDEVAALERQRSQSKQLKTLRGRILDRNGKVLATDTPQFQISINYQLTRYWDRRVLAIMERMAQEKATNPSLYDLHEEITSKRDELKHIIRSCVKFGVTEQYVQDRIRSINNDIWNLQTFLAWYRNGPDPNFVAAYNKPAHLIPRRDVLPEFRRQVPDRAERYKKIFAIDDIPEVSDNYLLLDLRTEDDIFAAQMEFMDINDVHIVSKGQRYYPYGHVAAQTIGWVGRATQESDKELFEHDRLASYLPDDVCGRRPGVEYACETILRGRRGELVRDIDGNLVRSTETEYGRDVRLTLDIQLQQRIETYLTEPSLNPDYYQAGMSVVVIDVRSGDILALVSVPTFDLNRVQYDYAELITDREGTPLINRALYKHYPPGSSVKPIILIAAMEAGKITPGEVISCPAAAAPAGWPNCWIYKQNHAGHDWNWENNARNAVKGSCNIYFSHVANRLEAAELQQWLYAFGYGRPAPLAYPRPPDDLPLRRLRQGPGQISTTTAPRAAIQSVQDLPPLQNRDRPLFGIGQGNLSATPLQVANSYAALARGGHYKRPRLFLEPEPLTDSESQATTDLQISTETLRVALDGMDAVVNESGGTAHAAFTQSGLERQGVKVRGKTGSTEGPENAWFAGFVEDVEGAKIALAVVVEGGQHGSSDAAPLARDIIQLCILSGYVGHAEPASVLE